MTLRWFISKTVRQAAAMRKHVRSLLNSQRDILSPQAVQAVTAGMDDLGTAIRNNAKRDALLKQMEKLEDAANKWLKPYPNAGWRENVEVLLVALSVAMGIRTFFVQPFKIPTGSMQPTLFGVTSTPDFSRLNPRQDDARVEAEIKEQMKLRDSFVIPTGWQRVKDWFAGISYIDVKAKADGMIESIGAPVGIRIIDFWQTIRIGGVAHMILLPPDYGSYDLKTRAGLQFLSQQEFHKGDQVVRLKEAAGDHLFVDRLTYNFRKPLRGEIVVFQTGGIPDPRMPQDQFYIKRLVALGGERVQIGNDRHLVINGRRLDASTPHFENVYSFDPRKPPQPSQYSGHVNEVTGDQNGRYGLAPLFPNESAVHEVAADHYMVMGDNTVDSFDSRGWGEFPAANVIGKSYFVYWPITSRFGWGHR